MTCVRVIKFLHYTVVSGIQTLDDISPLLFFSVSESPLQDKDVPLDAVLRQKQSSRTSDTSLTYSFLLKLPAGLAEAACLCTKPGRFAQMD